MSPIRLHRANFTTDARRLITTGHSYKAINPSTILSFDRRKMSQSKLFAIFAGKSTTKHTNAEYNFKEVKLIAAPLAENKTQGGDGPLAAPNSACWTCFPSVGHPSLRRPAGLHHLPWSTRIQAPQSFNVPAIRWADAFGLTANNYQLGPASQRNDRQNIA